MPIEMSCTGCGQTLRVADEHAGKMARCPKCGTVVAVPAAESDASAIPLLQPVPDFLQPAASSNPFADRPDQITNPYAAPSVPQTPVSSYRQPHRGGMILTVGIAGLLCCMPLGIVAWVMGASDLKAIRAGTMDPAGQSMTQAGMVIGIISVVLTSLGIVANVLIVVLSNLP
ncbi:MAG: hypothetical protein NTY19_32755 [Planctomycetota bacterium]|nr:hypothetical protein [Planctomycetota bacterium]